jgi:lipopolysaccharide/colanic/teichoic acid biosynthesis glycosyltransferase
MGQFVVEWSRALDMIRGCILTAFTLPVMVILALAIRLDSPRPVLSEGDLPYLRPTYGYCRFRFRALDESDRIRVVALLTRLGQSLPLNRFPHLTRIEELWQLFNMLRSDLALFSGLGVMRWLRGNGRRVSASQ